MTHADKFCYGKKKRKKDHKMIQDNVKIFQN